MVGHLAELLSERRLSLLLAAVLLYELLLLRGGQVLEVMGIKAQYHAVAGALSIGLRGGDNADIVEELVPEAAV